MPAQSFAAQPERGLRVVPGTSGHLVYLRGLTSLPSPAAVEADLSARELEWIVWATEGASTKQIATVR
ncbi:MAG: hypothetical protein MUE52_08210 [Tabrizicola sp.]|jgi:hypothetical protein|nr:hypothetical protein [Tabrizicola sp.]